MSTVVTSKGQVTIPKKVRDWLGITPGTAVEFDLRPDGQVVLVKAGQKARRTVSRFAQVRGTATAGMSTDEIMALTPGRAMTGVLLDSNVILDLVTDDPVWGEWSLQQIEAWALKEPLFINAVIYAEASIGFTRIEEFESVLTRTGIATIEIPHPALFLAGKAFRSYRRKGGPKGGVLPDFFIGAHAAVTEIPVITRDLARYRTYFPTVVLVSPGH